MKGRIPAVLTVIAFFAGAGTAQAQFTQEGSPYATGNAPYTAYAADFNGDGRQDVVTSNGDAQTVSVFLRQARGGFAPEPGSPFPLPGATSNGAAGDFNGDGRPDLAIADFVQGAGVVIALRSAAGGFTRESNVQPGGALSAVGAGDFNQDGRTDIAAASWQSGQVSVYLRTPANDGFALAPDGNYFVGTNPRQIAIADFNGDLRSDIAVVNVGSSTVVVLLNAGGGTFTPEPATAVGAQPNGITAGDYDGDGRPDLAVSNTGADTVSILLRSPLGGFTPAAGSPVAVGDGPVTLASADFDGNGTLDIAAAVSAGSLDVIRRGAAGFVRDTTTAVSPSASGLAVADFNADGRTDAAVSSLVANVLTVLLSPPPPAQPPPAPTPTPTPTLPPPVANQRVNVTPVTGKVRIKLRGTSRYVDLAAAGQQIPVNSSIDTRDGRVRIQSAPSRGKVDTAEFFDGLFKLTQSRGLTTLSLTEALDCRKQARTAAKKPKSRKLWGSGKGKFRTKGQYSAATIRGTEWLVQDGCGYTRTKVKVGSVNVRDTVAGRTVIVRKGKTYTARAGR